MEDDLKKKREKNRRQPQKINKWKTTSKKMEDYLKKKDGRSKKRWKITSKRKRKTTFKQFFLCNFDSEFI
jgi:hypothetical protein